VRLRLAASGENRFPILLGLSWAYLVTLARAWRWPNDWAEAHWLVNYTFGFLKRALPGTVILPLLDPADAQGAETVIRLVSTAIFAVSSLVLAWMAWRILQHAAFDRESVAFVLLFATSPYVVLSAHLNGYYDHIIVILVCLGAWLAVKQRFWAAALVLSLGVLVHEAILLVGYGSVLLVVVLLALRRPGPGGGRRSWLVRSLFPLVSLPLLTFVILFGYQSRYLQPFEMNERLASHLARYAFVEGDRHVIVPTAFTASFRTFIEAELPWFWERLLRLNLLLPIGASLTVMLAFTGRWLRGFSHAPWLMAGSAVVALLPLAMHTLAIDTARIWAYPLFVGQLTAWIVLALAPGTANDAGRRAPAARGWLVAACMLAAVMQMVYSPPLMDGALERFDLLWRLILYMPALAALLWSFLPGLPLPKGVPGDGA
jgi:hypothetical protein